MTSEFDVQDPRDEVRQAGTSTPASFATAVTDPLRSLRMVKWLTRLFVYPGIALLIPLDHTLWGLTWQQSLSVHLGGFLIATIAIEAAFGQAFKLRKHAAYPNVLLVELGKVQTVAGAAQQALAVIHHLLGLRASFFAFGVNPDAPMTAVSGMSRTTARRFLQVGMSGVQEAMRTQSPVPFRSPGLVLPETMPASDERLVFVPVIGLKMPIGVLALVGHKGNGDLKDDQLLSGIGSALGLSLENLRQQEELRESEQHFRSLIENASDIIIILNADATVRYISPSIERVMGYEPEDLIGRSAIEGLVHPDDVASVTEAFTEAVQDPDVAPSMAVRVRDKDGEWHAFEGTIKNLIDDSVVAGLVLNCRDVTERKQAAEALARREEEFRALAENAPDIIARFDRELRHEYVNPAVERVLGMAQEEVIGKTHPELGMPEELYSHWQAGLRQVFQTGQESVIEFGTQSGSHYYQSRLVPEFAEGGSIESVLTITRDITGHKQAEEALRESEAQFRTLADTVAAAAFIFQGTKMRYVNSAAEAVTGYTQNELLAMNFWDVIHPDFKELVREQGLARQRGEDVPARYEVKIVTKRGEERWVDFTAGAIDFEGKPAVLGTAFDITERKRAEETIRHQAYHDPLTDLPNRMLFEDRLAVALAQAHRKAQMTAVMFLDLDRFKVVNDTVGHALGDRLLKGVAERLMGLVRDGDSVARVGGDEFTVLLPDVARPEETVEVAERILDVLRQPWVLNGHEFHITTSIGIAMYPNDGEDAESLLRNADTAMYRAKDGGRDNFKLYTPTMNARIAERLALENSLRHGLERGEFVVYYQPQVDISSGRIVGMEALVRWQHPERGLISPAEFIPVAEETGLIVPLGAWVLRTACALNKAWQEAGVPHMRMAVNLSARQFQLRDLIDTVAQVLEETRLDPQFLQLEITEGVAMQDVEFTVMMLRELREMGVQIAMDDFGTGHSSLSYLKRFPINILKIDQSFVRDLTVDPDDAAIASTIIMMAHNLKLKVIAEGVETEDQLAFLRERQCDEMQGYLFSKPAPAEAFEAMLRQGGGRSRARRPVRANR